MTRKVHDGLDQGPQFDLSSSHIPCDIFDFIHLYSYGWLRYPVCEIVSYHITELIPFICVACISNVTNLSVDNSEFRMIVNPGENPDDRESAAYLNPIPLTVFKDSEKSPTGSRPLTLEAFKPIPLPNILLIPAFGFSTTQNSMPGFQKIVVSFGSKVRVSLFLLSDFHRLI